MIGNLGGTVAIVFFNLGTTHATRTQARWMIGLVTAGLMAYELIQGMLPRSVFDWKDLAATPIVGLIALGYLEIIHWLLPEGAVADKPVMGEPS